MDNQYTEKMTRISLAIKSLKADKEAVIEMTKLPDEQHLFFLCHHTLHNFAYDFKDSRETQPGLVPIHRAFRFTKEEGQKALEQLSHMAEQPRLTPFLQAIEQALLHINEMIKTAEIELSGGIPQAGASKVH